MVVEKKHLEIKINQNIITQNQSMNQKENQVDHQILNQLIKDHLLNKIQRINQKQKQKQTQNQTQNMTLPSLIIMIEFWNDRNLGIIKNQLSKRNFKKHPNGSIMNKPHY